VLARLVEEVSGTLADEGLTVEVAGPCCREGLTSPCDPKFPPLRRLLVSVRAHRLAGSIEASRPRSKRPSVRTGLNGNRGTMSSIGVGAFWAYMTSVWSC
jgi:hypothetical protein